MDGFVRPNFTPTNSTVLSHRDYTVGWICALPTEMAAAQGMLDMIHQPLPRQRDLWDQNNYAYGQIGAHNVVLACLPSGVTGTIAAANVAHQMHSSFEGITIRLMVGIGGGVPSQGADIRLGDVVVSKPKGDFGGVIQYDFGRTVGMGDFRRTGMLNRPPDNLLAAVSGLAARHMIQEPELSRHVGDMIARHPRMLDYFSRPATQHDRLYNAGYDHPREDRTCADCCDPDRLVERGSRRSDDPVVHYGLIATGNQVMRHGLTRDSWARELGVLCFEMEAAGLINHFPCLVIRGISDYADSHKNDLWQGYAAATAAAYAKELLLGIPGPGGEEAVKQHHWLPAAIKAKFGGNRCKFIKAAERGDNSTPKELPKQTGQMSQLKKGTINEALIAVSSNKERKDEHVATVQALLERGAEPGCKDDKYHRTPLIWAIIFDRGEIVDVLLKHSALIDTRDEIRDWTPLMWAVHHGRDAITGQLLLRGASLEAQDKDGLTPLALAYKRGDKSAAELLVKWGADTSFKFKSGLPLLISAMMVRDDFFVRLLVENNADVNCMNKDGLTPLALAYKEGYRSAAELLVKWGADTSFKFKSGLPLLISAMMVRDDFFVSLLVENNADVNCMNKDGLSPLALAYKEGYRFAAELLVKSGADTSFKFKSGLPLLISAIMTRDEFFVRLLVTNKADVNCRNNDDEPALIIAVKKGYRAIGKLLIDNGADLEAEDRQGRTALIWAVGLAHRDLVKLLVEQGANKAAADKEGATKGRTVVEWAKLTKNRKIIELVV